LNNLSNDTQHYGINEKKKYIPVPKKKCFGYWAKPKTDGQTDGRTDGQTNMGNYKGSLLTTEPYK
jgi:uncharacterized protein involved in high-affinity Fe2+ transport